MTDPARPDPMAAVPGIINGFTVLGTCPPRGNLDAIPAASMASPFLRWWAWSRGEKGQPTP